MSNKILCLTSSYFLFAFQLSGLQGASTKPHVLDFFFFFIKIYRIFQTVAKFNQMVVGVVV